MKRKCWGCNAIVEPERVDGLDRCPRCGNLGAFGGVAQSCARIALVAAALVAAALLALALLACSPQATEPATVTITQRGGWYVATVSGATDIPATRVGATPAEAAAIATRLMLRHAVENPAGGSLVAPAEVRALVPPHLRDVPARQEVP